MSDLAIVVLAEIRDNVLRAIADADRGGDSWHEDELIVDAVAMRLRELSELAKYSFPEDEKKNYRRG